MENSYLYIIKTFMVCSIFFQIYFSIDGGGYGFFHTRQIFFVTMRLTQTGLSQDTSRFG